MLKRHFSYKVCLTFFFVVFLFSCRKEQASVSVPQEIVAERFFNEHRTNSTEEKHLVDYLSRLNEKKGFINKTVERIGFPHWDKLVKYSFLSNSSGNVASLSTGSSSKQDSATNYIIPFVRDTQNNVNAAMFIKTDKGDTSISYLCDWQYTKFRTPAQISQAKDIAMFFMLFDRKVYGHEKFDVLDSALFRKDNKKAITISFNNTDSSNTNGFSTYTCTSYTITYYHCPAPVGSCNGYQGECDGCFDYCRTDDSFTICNWVASVSPPGNDFGGGGTPPPDNGSGSNIGGSGNNDVAVPPSNNDGLRPGWRWAKVPSIELYGKEFAPDGYFQEHYWEKPDYDDNDYINPPQSNPTYNQDGYRKNGQPYHFKNGYVQNYTNDKGEKYAIFTIDNSGAQIKFPGVTITDYGVPFNSGVTTSNGGIHADLATFGLAALQHEYGHYLQARKYGSLLYNAKIVPASLWSKATSSVEVHRYFWTELEANQLAINFFGNVSEIATKPDLYPR